MNQTPYDSMCKQYNSTRNADPKIIETISSLLDLPGGSTIADIGAGTGNYSLALTKLNYKIKCVEPSVEMIKQATPDKNITWFHGSAERIPLVDNSVDGIIMILSLHHFSSVKDAAKEAARICPKGPLVIFTMDPRESEDFWFNRYFPTIAKHVEKSFLPIAELLSFFTSNNHWLANIIDFPLSSDLTDRNMCSGWNTPETYFDAQFRQNTSGFALADQSEVEKGLARLRSDLSSGEWDRKYGFLRSCSTFDAGFRFIRFSK